MTTMTNALDRRSFLRGAGVTVALPFLDAMRFGPAREPARRMVCVYFPNGAAMPEEDDTKWNKWRWFPNRAGAKPPENGPTQSYLPVPTR